MTSTTRATGVRAFSSGVRIFSMDDMPSCSPRKMTMNETMTPERYSMRAWPNGCFSSAGLLAILKPMSVTTDEPESVRLLTASAVTETL